MSRPTPSGAAQTVSPSPSIRILASAKVWLANLAFSLFIGTAYLAHAPETESLAARTFAVLALISTVFLLTLVPGLVLVLLARVLSRVRVIGGLHAFVWIAFQILLFTDTRVHNIFRYHWFDNGHVWNLMFTRGAEDSVHLGWQVWAAVVAGLTLGFSVEYTLWKLWLRREVNLAHRPPVLRYLLHPGVLVLLVIVPVIGVEKTLYAHADFAEDREVTQLAQLFPLYPHIAAKDFAEQVFGPEVFDVPPADTPRIDAGDPQARLDYPLAQPLLDPDAPRPNVLIVAIDCWRADMFTEETTPGLVELAAQGRTFEDHLSGGNSTRFGIFSMLYGLHGSYWFPMLAEQRSPVLVDALREEGYEFAVYSAASMLYPELRDTAWVDLPDAVHDEFPAEEAWQRDQQSAAAFRAWMQERAARDEEAPFFSFVLVDSPHPVYSYPPRHEVFLPVVEELNYLTLSDTDGPAPELMEGVRNRYKNALRHADEVALDLVDAVRAAGELEDTLIVITGDHGEEFLDHGFFGHTSNFTAAQTAVPLLLLGPGIAPGVVHRPTSHLDLPATILEACGADPADRGAWTLGGNLLDPHPADRARVASAWKELGLILPAGDVLKVPLHDRWSFRVEVYDAAWRFQLDAQSTIDRELPQLVDVAEECRRFLR